MGSSLGVVGSLLLSCTEGYILVGLFLGPGGARLTSRALRLSLAPGIGLGFSSLLTYICLRYGTSAAGVLGAVEACALSALLFAYGRISRACRRTQAGATNRGPAGPGGGGRSRLRTWIGAVLLVGAVSGLVTFFVLSLSRPHGSWDARGIWDYRARMIFRDLGGWIDAYGNQAQTSHPDYPLLLPLSVVRCWLYAGGETVAGPIGVALVYTFATVALLISGLSLLSGRSQGYLGALALLGIPLFLQEGASQYADVPVSCYFLSTLVLLACHDTGTGKGRGLIVLAGLTCGLSAWTKNEGLLFLAVVLCSRGVSWVRRGEAAAWTQEVLFLLLGLIPVAGVLLHFKYTLATQNDLLAAMSLESFRTRITDPARYWTILRYSVGQLVRPEKWGLFLFLAVPYLLLARRGSNPGRCQARAFGLLTLALMAAGYLVVYLTDSYDLVWHLRTSMNRLFMQLAPSLLLFYFLGTAGPEEVIGRYGKSPPSSRRG